MDYKILYEDQDMMVVDKPAGIVVFPEGQTKENTLIDLLIDQKPELKEAGEAPRYGIVHRLDKDTSGVLLVAKTKEALKFLQKQFINRGVEKEYLALATGALKDEKGVIHTLITRSKSDPRKQKASWLQDAKPEGKREAITHYKVIQKFKDFTLVELDMKSGRKHQIRTHLAYIHHPIAGDKLYGFKDSKQPEGLTRQFLHASDLKIETPQGEIKEFHSELPKDLKNVLDNLEK
jgi:23S rRNA pseudouridine1911/1915/1917 synthase